MDNGEYAKIWSYRIQEELKDPKHGIIVAGANLKDTYLLNKDANMNDQSVVQKFEFSGRIFG